MPNICCVPSCRQKQDGKGGLFAIPKKEKVEKAWFESLDMMDYYRNRARRTRLVVCFRHFRLEDFDFSTKILVLKKRKGASAVPQVEYLTETHPSLISESQKAQLLKPKLSQRAMKIDTKEKNELLAEIAFLEQELKLERQGKDPLTDKTELVGKVEALEKELNQQKSLFQKLQEEYRKKIDDLACTKRKLQYAKKELRKNETRKIPVAEEHEIVQKYLKNYFTQAQIAFLLRKASQKGHWGQEDYEFACQLHKLSSNAYEFLRAENKLPLPSFMSLNRWKSDPDFQKFIKEKEQLRKSKKESTVAKTVKAVKPKPSTNEEEYEEDLPCCSNCRKMFLTEGALLVHSRDCSPGLTIRAESNTEFDSVPDEANEILNEQETPLLHQYEDAPLQPNLDASKSNQSMNFETEELSEFG